MYHTQYCWYTRYAQNVHRYDLKGLSLAPKLQFAWIIWLSNSICWASMVFAKRLPALHSFASQASRCSAKVCRWGDPSICFWLGICWQSTRLGTCISRDVWIILMDWIGISATFWTGISGFKYRTIKCTATWRYRVRGMGFVAHFDCDGWAVASCKI